MNKTAERTRIQLLNLVSKTGKLDPLVQLEIAQHLMSAAFSMMTRVKVSSKEKRKKMIGLQKVNKLKAKSK